MTKRKHVCDAICGNLSYARIARAVVLIQRVIHIIGVLPIQNITMQIGSVQMVNARKVGEVGMRIHEMTISMIADNGLMPVTVTYNSPKRIVSGARVRFGWFFIRIGARILYRKGWEGR
jgi:hypothetical protein